MAQSWFKRNEKLLMVLLLLILAPTFAFTGIMTAVLSNPNQEYYEVFGKTITNKDWAHIVSEYQQVQRALYSPAGRIRINPGDILEYYIFREEADRLGIAVGDEELSDAIRESGKALIIRLRLTERFANAPTPPTRQEISQAQQELQKVVHFNHEDYRQALKILLGLSIQEYEEAFAKGLRTLKLRQAAAESVVVSEPEIYAEFVEQEHKRVFSIVGVPAKRFETEALEQITEEDIERVYDERPDLFRTRDRLAVEVLKVLPEALEGREPTEEEIQARYEKDKQSLYLAIEEFDLEAEGPEYLPLEEVRDRVIESVKESLANSVQVELLGRALDEGKRRFEANEEFELIDVVPEEERAFVQVIKSDPFARDEIEDLPEAIRHEPTYRGDFLRFASLKKGEFGADVTPLQSGSFIYRIVELDPSHVPALSDCREDVRKRAAEEKTWSLTADFLNEWKERIEEDPETTLETLAAADNYTVDRSEPVGRSEGTELREGIEGFYLAQAGFAIRGEGEIGEPVTRHLESPTPEGVDAEKKGYLIRLDEVVPPSSADFTDTLRNRLKRQLTARKSQAAYEEYRSEIFARANVREIIQPQPEQ